MVVVVDERYLRAADRNSKLQYLLQLLADGAIESFLYSDAGPPTGTPRAIGGEPRVEAPIGWVEIRPGGQDRLREVAWIKDGTPTVRVATIEDNAYYRIMASASPPEYVLSGTPETLQLADAHAMLAANTIQADLYVTDRALPIALGRDEWSSVTLMSVDDALPVVGLFLRRQGRFKLAHNPALGQPNQPASETARDQNFFYWEAAGLVLPDSWRWRVVSETHARRTGNESLRLLNTAVRHRLSQVLRSRDNLLARTSVTQNMDTADDILNDWT